VPSTYEGLDHSEKLVAEFWRKKKTREADLQKRRKKEATLQSNSFDASSHSLGRRGNLATRNRDTDVERSINNAGREKNSKTSSSFCRGAKSPVFMAVSNCDNAGERKRLLSAFMQVLPIDSYGNCLRNSELGAETLPACAALPSSDWRAQKECMMSCYPFVLSLESTHSEVDYATEKLFDPIMHESVVPIYLGPPNEREFLPLQGASSKSVILVRDFVATKGSAVDEETMRRVARHVASLARNASAMRELLKWKKELSEQVSDTVSGGCSNGATKKHQRQIERGFDINFPFKLRSWFSHRRFFCNLCTRYAAEKVEIGYNACEGK
jgi:Glycosyltransferase family 10 (fucosyltransferase) C-term